VPRVTAAMVAAGRTIGEPRLSPDGRTVAFVSSGARSDLVLVPVDGGPEVVVTTEPAPSRARPDGGGVFGWHPDGGALVYAAADGGVWLQPVAGGPPRRVAAPDPAGPAESPTVSPDGGAVAYTVDSHHVAVAPLDGDGWPRLVSSGADFALDPAWSPAGELAWHEWDAPDMPWTGSRIVVDGKPAAGGDGVAVGQPRWSADGRLGWVDDASGWANVRPLAAPDDHEHGRPAWGPGIRTWCWSPRGAEVAVGRNEDGFGRLVLLPSGRELARGWHWGLDWHGGTLVAIRSGARTPTQLVAYDVATGEQRTLAHGPVAGWGAADLVEPTVGRTSEGVPFRLYAPAGVERPPLLCWVHGGPTDQRVVAFNARFAWWLDRGWAILDVDHRGSTGHGRAHERALHHRWGEIDVDDCAAAVRHVLDAALADPDRVAVIGASAGGFTALLLLARHPELFAAGVAVSAVADLVDLAARSHRFERHSTLDLVGDHAAHVERSPLAHAERIAAPLLLLHGDDDPVVPVDQARALASRLGVLGRNVTLHEYEGEGHGWSRPATVVDELERTEAFLARHVLREVGR
jgi:dipeptidyl aminopeptidase/acylaminoacyl peptidase